MSVPATGKSTGEFVGVRLDGDNRDMEKFCSQCDASMSCDPGNGCWCADLPHVLPVPDVATKGCLCRSCLMKQLEQRVPSRQSKSEPSFSSESPAVLGPTHFEQT